MSKYLIQDGNSRFFHLGLAEVIGLNEAIVLQQVHYWLTTSEHQIDGRLWVYNSYEGWNKQFPYWSLSMVRRLFKSLEVKGYLLSGNFNKTRMDQTKWYSIDYQKLEELELGVFSELAHDAENMNDSSVQEETVNHAQQTDEGNHLSKAIPKNTTENYSKNISFYIKVIDYLNTKNKSGFRANNRKTKSVIQARLKEGYTLEDFKKVIDTKVDEWSHHPQMSKYLRPETLFGNKFESYLHQKTLTQQLREEDFNLCD